MQNTFNLWLIPLLPLLSAVVIRLFGRWALSRTLVHLLACTSVFASFVITVMAFLSLRSSGTPILHDLFTWLEVGEFRVGAALLLDPLSSVMALVVTGVGFLIHVYSAGYMGHEKDYHRYFSYLNLFTAMMLILVLGNSLLLMFVGWEGVGLCSYLLIGFWFSDHANADAGKKAFVVNRIGDFGFIIGMLTLWWVLGMEKGVWSFDYSVLRANVDLFSNSMIFGLPVVTFVGIMLFIGATGKSAQIPLYVWLPDAMAGPTPVSALIHAATMVTSGVYMIARMSFLFDAEPLVGFTGFVAKDVILVVGTLTAVVAATIGLVQNDIKKVLAYSTVSQLGYMFMACGVGAYVAGINHVMTHAFFKALLFLGSGSVIHAMHHEQDMRKMGGLKKYIPHTYKTFLIGTIAIAGFPPFAGFWSKDEILWQAFSGGHKIAWAMGLIAAFMTSFYMFRLLFMTFFGECRADEETKHHLHESPKSMLIPLYVLAFLSIVGGFFYIPAWLEHSLHVKAILPAFLSDVVVYTTHEGDHFWLEIGLASLSVAVALMGFLLARALYVKNPSKAAQIAKNHPFAHRILLNKYYVDEFYNWAFVGGSKKFASLCSWFDRTIVDGFVHLCAWVVRIVSFIEGTIDRLLVDGLVNMVGRMTFFVGRWVRTAQTGQIQVYVGTIAGVMVVFILAWMSFVIG